MTQPESPSLTIEFLIACFDVLQSDDPEGEIDLTSCVEVSDCYVEKNYGLQIHVCTYCPADCDVLMTI